MRHLVSKPIPLPLVLVTLAAVTLALMLAALEPRAVEAKEELVTLPVRDSVSLTVYNDADLTYVQEVRTLGFRAGVNKLQFSWANTLIDPTSVLFQPLSDAAIEVTGTTYPKEDGEMLIWDVEAEEAGSYPVKISYFTSGISWSASYQGTLSPLGDQMDLTGYVTVNNQSGEEYENASVRLIVGQVNLVEEIRTLALAARFHKMRGYFEDQRNSMKKDKGGMPPPEAEMPGDANEAASGADDDSYAKSIVKESVGEYFMYTVEGRETIPHGWSKRLVVIRPVTVSCDQRYDYERKEYGPALMRLIFFRNDEEYGLGNEPLPPGPVRIFGDRGESRLSFAGTTSSEYIPIGDEVKWNLGVDPNVTMETKVMKTRHERLAFAGNRADDQRLIGYDREVEYVISFRNFRDVPVEIEFHANPQHPDFDFENLSAGAEKVDAYTQKWLFDLPAEEEQDVSFRVVFREGRNRR